MEEKEVQKKLEEISQKLDRVMQALNLIEPPKRKPRLDIMERIGAGQINTPLPPKQ